MMQFRQLKEKIMLLDTISLLHFRRENTLIFLQHRFIRLLVHPPTPVLDIRAALMLLPAGKLGTIAFNITIVRMNIFVILYATSVGTIYDEDV